MTGLVSEITNFSTRDGPGIRTTVFLMGCPLRCKWCSNPETFIQKRQLYYVKHKCVRCGKCETVCPQGAISLHDNKRNIINRRKCVLCFQCVAVCMYKALRIIGSEYSTDELMEIIERDKVFYGNEGGITISGGEPLSQGEFTKEIFRRCKEKGISTVLDTSACGNQDTLKEILKYTDLVLLDIKHIDQTEHRKWTGVSNELILENARVIASSVPVRISLPLIAGVNDSIENISNTANFALENGIGDIDIEPIHFLGKGKYQYLGKRQPYGSFHIMDNDEVNSVLEVFREKGLNANIGRMI